MRRFSERNPLVTLSDINVTPLIDLAFVLLIIFVISTPLIDYGMELRLPAGGEADRRLSPNNIRTVEINTNGQYRLQGRAVSLDQLEQELVALHRDNPNLIVYVRADEESKTKYLYPVIDRCQRNGITRFSLRTRPELIR